MIRISLSSKIICIVAIILAGAMTSCQNKPHGIVDGAEITKVKYYRFRPYEVLSPATDAMVSNERQYHRHGVYRTEDVQKKTGNYYAVFWKSDNKAPVKLKFQYLQRKKIQKVQTKWITIDDPKRKNVTKVEIVGDEFSKGGDVRAWKASIVSSGKTVATYQSYLWGK